MKLVALWLAVAGLAVAEESVTGIVLDAAGAAVPGARLTLSTARQNGAGSAESGPDGRFRLAGVHPESYVLTAEKPGFAPSRTALRVEAGRAAEITVKLAIQAMSSEVTVTAETGLVGSAFEVAQQVNLVDRAAIDQRAHTVAIEALREEPGVDIQRTAPVMGGVAVRGLLGKNVAVYRDGVRYTTSAQRGGVSTFLNLTDATNLDSVEVLRGPNSAQYGSDSLGGTVHFLSRAAPVGANSGWSGEFAPSYSSGSHTFGGNVVTSYGGPRFGVVTNLVGRRQNTWRSGQGIESHAAVTRFLGLPSTVLGERSTDTAFTQYGGMVHAQGGFTPRDQIVFHYERGQQDGGKRWDQLLGGDGNLIADLRNLMLDFGYLRYTRLQAGPFDQATATLSLNSQREERVNQGGNGNPTGAVTHQYERTTAWGLSLNTSEHWRGHDFLIGADGYRESMRAPAFTTSSTGVTTLTRPRVPNGARELLYGVYAQESWSRGPVRLGGAIRFGGASYRSRASNSPFVGGLPLWPDDSLAANAVSGRASIVYRIGGPVAAHFNYSRGFRAPSMTDLGTVGIQGNGFYEASFADLAGRGAFIGDRADDRAVSTGRPLERARAEASDNYDFGFRVAAARLRASATGFIIDLGNTIVSQTLILPLGAEGQPLGDQIITRQLDTGAVFVPAATAPVLARANLGGARFAGFEQTFEAQVARSVTVGENVTWIDATDHRTGLPPDIEGGIPPTTANLRVRWSPAKSRFWVEPYATVANRQGRLSSLALADRRTGAARSRANIQSFFNNGARVRGLVVNGILVPTGETLAQVQNRVLGAENSAPMFTAIPGYGIFGVRGGVAIGERQDVLVDWSNLLDKNYRGVSWGIDGPGRSLALRYRVRF
jgi:hemoglobin/transferrin/lactoferrin receptor protein